MNTFQAYNIVIADSQFLIAESLKSILRSDSRFNITLTTPDQEELIKTLKEKAITLLIIDSSQIEFAALSIIKQRFPKLSILVLTNTLNRKELQELNELGISDIILKSTDKKELFAAIEATIHNQEYYAQILFSLRPKNKTQDPAEEISQLTNTEIEIVRLMSNGYTTKEIASHKFISYHTVITHRKNIFRKLGVNNALELLILAIKGGIIDNIEYHIG